MKEEWWRNKAAEPQSLAGIATDNQILLTEKGYFFVDGQSIIILFSIKYDVDTRVTECIYSPALNLDGRCS